MKEFGYETTRVFLCFFGLYILLSLMVFPHFIFRGYYRCTHRNIQGCLATKQVQRSDDDPTVFEITYRGRHTCNQHPAAVVAPFPPPENQAGSSASVDAAHLQIIQPQPQQNQTQSQDVAFDFLRDLKVITQNLDSNNDNHNQSSSMFGFPSTSDNIFGIMSNSSNFSSTSPFLSSFQVGPNFGSSESELAMIVSAATSGNNSRATVRSDSDLPRRGMEFANENISFDNTGSFP